jgi:phosphonatase-like hydrolase
MNPLNPLTGSRGAHKPSRRTIGLDLVIFDLTGTTVRDEGQVAQAFTGAFCAHGINITPEALRTVRGSSKRQAVLSLMPACLDMQALAEAVYASFRNTLATLYVTRGVQPVTGADKVFRFLKGMGARVALNTGFDREITGLLITALGWGSDLVDAVVCGDDVANGRPAPDLIFRAMALCDATTADRVMAVGDTTLDLQAGHNAGVRWNIGVLTGAHDRQTLEQAPHTILLPSIAQIPEYLRSL